MPSRITAALRGASRLVALAPALIVALTALFVLPQQAGGFRLAKWGALGMALAVVGVALLARRRPARLPRRWLALGGFMAAAVVLPALSPSLAKTHWPTALGLLSGLGLFLVTAISLDDDDEARRASLVVLVGVGVLCAAVVALQAVGLRWLTSDVYTGLEFRAPATFGNPNWAAAFIGALVPLSLGLTAIAEHRWLHRAATALLVIATVATLSKGGVLAMVAGVLVFVCLGQRRGVLAAVLGGAAIVGALVCAFVFASAPWLRGRLFLWRAALLLVGEHPLTGVGLGGYLPAYGRAAASLIDGDPSAFMPLSSVDFVHHDALQLAAEGGLVTAALFVLVVVSAIVCAHRRADPLSRAVGASLAALAVNGLVDSPMRVPATFALFFFLLGWLSPIAPRSSTGASRLLLVVIVLLGALQGVRFTAGNAYWTLGRDALFANRPATSLLARACFFLPEHGRSASQYARSLARAGRSDAAIAALSAAASLRFDFDDEILRRDLQSRSLDPTAAIQLWREFSADFPALVTPHLRLGALSLQVNDRASAIAAYEAVLANPQPTERAEAAREQARSLLRSLD